MPKTHLDDFAKIHEVRALYLIEISAIAVVR